MAMTVDLPHWRAQFNKPRIAPGRRTRCCWGSAMKPKRSRAKAMGSDSSARGGTGCWALVRNWTNMLARPRGLRRLRAPGEWAGEALQNRLLPVSGSRGRLDKALGGTIAALRRRRWAGVWVGSGAGRIGLDRGRWWRRL